MRKAPWWLWVGVFVAVVAMVAIVVTAASGAKTHTLLHPTPVTTVTAAPVPTAAPTSTPSGQPDAGGVNTQSGDDASSGCTNHPSCAAGDTPPPAVTQEAVDLLPKAEQAIRAYTSFDTAAGKNTWNAALAPYTGSTALPWPYVSRQSEADPPAATAVLSDADPFIVTNYATTDTGDYQYRGDGVVNATYLRDGGFKALFRLNTSWVVTISHTGDHRVLSIVDKAPTLTKAFG